MNNTNITGTGQGIGIGPFIGYKVAASFGLTFVAQLGAQYNIATAEATDGTTTETDSASGIGPLLNLNLGWSF